jgi:hypothetical protein
MFLKPFIEKQAWNLYRQNASFYPQRFYRLKPGFKALGRYVVFDDLKAAVPNVSTSFIHIVSINILITSPQTSFQWGCYGTSNIQKKSYLKNNI